jgi:peroxiredoxin (alkyl hydroperoxide reductase subunit C)
MSTTPQHQGNQMPLLPLNAPAPYFEGRSTQGFIRLSDFAGKWLVFFAHPADFTPVCASEFVGFGHHADQFAALDCRLLGLSVDSVYSHLGWRESLRQHFGVSIDFPIMEDVSLQISRRYGMVHPREQGEGDVRALFVIDPRGILRAMLYYPASTGRSVNEVLRLLQALQSSDRQHVVTPEGWVPGEDAVEPAPQTVAVTETRRGLNYGCVDWYSYERSAGEGPGFESSVVSNAKLRPAAQK